MFAPLHKHLSTVEVLAHKGTQNENLGQNEEIMLQKLQHGDEAIF